MRQFIYRARLRCICKLLDIEPYWWQVEYALGKSNWLPDVRRCGKTTAVILRGLVQGHRTAKEIVRLAFSDPDMDGSFASCTIFVDEYRRLADQTGVRVVRWEWKVFRGAFNDMREARRC